MNEIREVIIHYQKKKKIAKYEIREVIINYQKKKNIGMYEIKEVIIHYQKNKNIGMIRDQRGHHTLPEKEKDK